MKKTRLTPQILMVILITSILVMIGVGVASFIYGQGILKKYAVELSHKQKDAIASNAAIQGLSVIKDTLNQNADVRTKIDQLRAKDQFPEFRIVDEVQAIAEKNNVTIKTFSYPDGTSNAGTQPAPAPDPNTAIPTPTSSASSSSGKVVSLLVDLESPVDHKALLQFIYDIEQHLPKMRIKGLSVSPADGATDKVNVSQLTIELYIN